MIPRPKASVCPGSKFEVIWRQDGESIFHLSFFLDRDVILQVVVANEHSFAYVSVEDQSQLFIPVIQFLEVST